MRADVAARDPNEACGLVAGKNRRSLAVIPITNILHSPVLYRMDPHEQLEAFNLLDEKGWDLLAIYHSHPQGPQGPSATDIQEAYYPDSVYLIWWREAGQWRCRGFIIKGQQVFETPLQFGEE